MRYQVLNLMTLGTLIMAVAGCAEGESRESPEDQAPVADAPSATTDAPSEASSTPERPTPSRPDEPVAEALTTVPAGTPMTFTVDQTVSSGEVGAGDVFTATLTSDVLGADGSVAVPAGTGSRWVVTQSTSDGGPNGEALLAFGLRSLDLDGRWVPVEATVTETDLRTTRGDSGTETAAKVAVGAAAGAIIGQILGRDTESTLKGAGVGAAVGTVVALTTREGEARLEEGSTVTVQLDEAVPVS